jgi:putative DNA primase/helicase
MNRSPDQQRAFDDWKAKALQADILSEAVARGAKLKRVGREYAGPCPACGGRDRFVINLSKRVFLCRGFGGGDAIAMVQHLDGCSFTQACEALTGEPPPNGQSKPLSASELAALHERRRRSEAAQRQREAAHEAHEENTRERAARIWGQTVPLPGTLAEKYLLGFGLPVPPGGWPDCLGFHPDLPYPGIGGRHPALIARVDDASGELTGIWREYIAADGGKAKVDNQKLGLGPVAGGAVRLGGIGPKIGVAEGVRTAAAAWALIGFTYPVWSCLSTAGLIGFEVPLGVDRIVIYSDSDQPMKKQGGEYVAAVPAGRQAAQAMEARLRGAGVSCIVASEPPTGTDFLDVWAAHSRELT